MSADRRSASAGPPSGLRSGSLWQLSPRPFPTLDAAGAPLVLTVHDLRNPHHRDVALHDAQLGVLVEAAAAIVTLTPGAAETIRRRWGRVRPCSRIPTSSTRRCSALRARSAVTRS